MTSRVMADRDNCLGESKESIYSVHFNDDDDDNITHKFPNL